MCPKFGSNEHLISVKDKTHPSYFQSTGDLSSEVKQLGREADSTTESSAGVTNALKYTSTTRLLFHRTTFSEAEDRF